MPISHMYGKRYYGYIMDPITGAAGSDYLVAAELTEVNVGAGHTWPDASGCSGVRIWRPDYSAQAWAYVCNTYLQITRSPDSATHEAKQEEVREQLEGGGSNPPDSNFVSFFPEVETSISISVDEAIPTTTISVAGVGEFTVSGDGEKF